MAISSAYGVGVDPQGNVWVADREDRFHIVAPDGAYLDLWGTSGSGQGEFEFLSRNAPVSRSYGDVAFDTEGNIYVADTGNSRIQKFASDRTFLTSWGGEGENDGQFLVLPPGSPSARMGSSTSAMKRVPISSALIATGASLGRSGSMGETRASS